MQQRIIEPNKPTPASEADASHANLRLQPISDSITKRQTALRQRRETPAPWGKGSGAGCFSNGVLLGGL